MRDTSPIRNAAPADAARIGAIAHAAYVGYVPRIGRPPAPMLTDVAAAIAAGRVVVIGRDGAIDGYMIAWPEPDAYLIDDIAVDPARHGRGLGRALVAHAIAAAQRDGLPAVRLYTNVMMTENLALYAHLGFVETRRATEDGFDRVFLRLELQSAM